MTSFLFPLAYLALDIESAYAIETGGIQGVVEDETGVPVPGAEVVLSGVELAGERRSTTPADGTFRFDNLSPGSYDLTVLFKGATVARAEVRVALNTVTQARIPAKMGGVSEEVEVVGFKPVIDTTASSFSANIGEETLQNLPVGRSYQAVVNTIPGVSGRVDTQNGGGGGSPSVRGEGGYGNNYTIDGVSTRDPATNTAGSAVNFDAIEEIQVYTDGAPAEFGQFTGMMVNVVTKDGGDEHHGSAAVFYSQHAWFDDDYLIYNPEAGQELGTTKAKFWYPNFAGTAGGPIIKEKLWYFTALDLFSYADRPEGLPEEADAITSVEGRFLAKATWFPTDALTLRYIFYGDYQNSPRIDIGPLVQEEASIDRRDLSQSHRLTATITPDPFDIFELRLGYLNSNIDTVPQGGNYETPSRQDISGILRDNTQFGDINNRNRLGGSLHYTRILDNVLGDHTIKAGAEYWYLLFDRDIRNTGETQIDWIDTNGNVIQGDTRDVGTRYVGATLGGVEFPCVAADYSDCAFREHWTNVGPLGNTVTTYTLFAQDDWKLVDQVTLNLGIRLDIEDGRNDEGDRPITQDPAEYELPVEERVVDELSPRVMPQPRLGFAIDPWADGKTKISGFYGSFYDISGGDFWEWSNTRSSAGFVRFVNDGTGNFVWSNTQDPQGNPLIYASTLKPARLDKVNIGVEREIIDNFSVGLRGILSQTTNIPEDIDVNLNDFYIMNSPIKERRYRALELTANKLFDDIWQVYGAVTLQESYGHLPGQFELASGAASGSNGNNVGVYLDDIGDRETREFFASTPGLGFILDGFHGLGRYDVTEPDSGFYDEAGWYGYLPYHSFVAVKLNGSYHAPFGTTFGLVYEFDSGHAWEKKTLVPFYGFDGFGQGRGSRFMPSAHYIDGRIAHTFEFNEDQSLEATLDIFNIPGLASPVTYWTNDEAGFGSVLFRQTPRGVRLGLKFRY